MGDNNNAPVVFGVMVNNDSDKKALKTMLVASGVCAFCQLVYTNCQAAVTGKYVQEFVFMFCLLIIPWCGYNGAKNRVRDHVSLFRSCSFLQGVVFAVIAINKFLDLKRAEETCYACSTERINSLANATVADGCKFTDWMGVGRNMEDGAMKDCVNLASPAAEYVSIFLCTFIAPVLCYAGHTANKVLVSSLFVMAPNEQNKFVVGVVEEIVEDVNEVKLSQSV
eukprot:g1289.t1